MQAYLVTIVCKFGRDPTICLWEEAIFQPAQKYLPTRRSDLRKSLQTDRRIDDGRLAMVLAHSWNELNKKLSYCWETVRRESVPRMAEMDVEMTT